MIYYVSDILLRNGAGEMVVLDYVMIGNRIKSRRKNLDLTQKQLGKIVNLSEGSISKYESGKIEDVTTTKLNKFAEALNVDITWLLGVELNRTSPERHSTVGTRNDDRLIELWRQLPPEKQQKMLSIIELELEECASSEVQEGA